jgi:hypothetical protein
VNGRYIDDLPANTLRDMMLLALGRRIGGGYGRDVFINDLNPQLVIKVERSGHQNPVEREIWEAVKNSQYAKWFAPVRFLSPYGSVLIMERTLPAPRKAYPKKVPEFLGDLKYSNFGLLRGRLVCHDYGTVSNFLHAIPGRVKMRAADWWDAADGASFDDGSKP